MIALTILFQHTGIIGVAMLSVLIVDDNLSEFFVQILSKSGYNTHSAKTVLGARMILETEKIDMALLDINLHGELGTDLIPELKEKKIPVFVMTAFNDMHHLAKDADGILEKPFDTEKLLTILGNIKSGK